MLREVIVLVSGRSTDRVDEQLVELGPGHVVEQRLLEVGEVLGAERVVLGDLEVGVGELA